MHLTVWTKSSPQKTLHSLSPVLKTVPGLPVTVVSDYTVPPETTTLLALGSDSLKYLQEAKVVAKNRTVTSLRTTPWHLLNIPLLVSYSPDIWEIDHGYYVDLLTDTGLAARHAVTGSWLPKYGQYRYVPDFADLCKAVEAQHAFLEEPVDLSFDLETLGLDPYATPTIFPPFPGGYIVTMQASHLKGTADVVRFKHRHDETVCLSDPVFLDQLEFLLNSPKVRVKGADFKFDQHWLWVRARKRAKSFTFDTALVGSLLDENRSNGLDLHAKVYVPALAGYSDEFDATVDKSRMDKVPPDKLLPYAGGDVDADLQVAEAQKKELLADPKLAAFYVNILHPAAHAFAALEQGGVVVDLNAYKALKADLEVEHLRLVKEASKIVGGRVVAKHMDLGKLGGMNLTKASMLIDFLFGPMGLKLKPKMFTEKPDKDGIKRPSTAMEHLEMFADVPEAKEFIGIIREDSSVMKTYDTYVVGFLEHLRSDGRFHPTYFLFVGDKMLNQGGAKTGRLSAKGPAWQTIPKHTKWAKRIRRCFPAPPGYVVVERDYSQGELRVAACIAHEANMIAAYKAGRDLHAETAGPFRGYDYAAMMALKQANVELFDAIRQLGKAGNFGLLFGMGAEGFMAYAAQNYGVALTLEEATAFRDGFFKKYPGLLVYHDTYKALAKRDRMVRTPLGRIRHLPLIKSPNQEVRAKAERQAINSPVQGTLTDMTCWSLALEYREGLHDIAPAFGSTHDSMSNYVPEDQVDVIVPKQLAIMTNLPFHKVGWAPQLTFVADAKVGPNLADLKAWGS
jgi:DNA polymerase I-like protein with 3'-5' exonuclease and polymerase domains